MLLLGAGGSHTKRKGARLGANVYLDISIEWVFGARVGHMHGAMAHAHTAAVAAGGRTSTEAPRWFGSAGDSALNHREQGVMKMVLTLLWRCL